MARVTANELRNIATAGRIGEIIDVLLTEARTSAAYGHTEYPIAPLHVFNALSAEDKVAAKQQIEALGFTFETRSFPGQKPFEVLKW